jgi:hypothetical protein
MRRRPNHRGIAVPSAHIAPSARRRRPIAAVLAFSLLTVGLAGGGVTLALWLDSPSASGVPSTMGDLKVTLCDDADAPGGHSFTWEETTPDVVAPGGPSPKSGTDRDSLEDFLAQPGIGGGSGDRVEIRQCVKAHLVGDNLAVNFTVNWAGPGPSVGSAITATYAVENSSDASPVDLYAATPGVGATLTPAVGTPTTFQPPALGPLSYSAADPAHDRTVYLAVVTTVSISGDPTYVDPLATTLASPLSVVLPDFTVTAAQTRTGGGF